MLGKSFAEVTFERGEVQGQLAASRTLILRMGRHRFGEPTTEQQARLDAIDSFDRFEMLTDAIMDATSWEDLLRRA